VLGSSWVADAFSDSGLGIDVVDACEFGRRRSCEYKAREMVKAAYKEVADRDFN
jgi:hypothetical protein